MGNCIKTNSTKSVIYHNMDSECENLTIKDVMVLSSHNSYISGIQHLSDSSINAIKNVLDKGARCIELDVFRDPFNKAVPIIAHGKELNNFDVFTTVPLAFEKAICFISDYAFEKTTDPLFLVLEVNVHEDIFTCDNIAYILEKYLGLYLISNKNIEDLPLSELKSKIILITGGGVKGDYLNKLVNQKWGDLFINRNAEYAELDKVTKKTILRTYPDGNIRGVFSLNYNTEPFYEKGVTFVSLNMQSEDAGYKTMLKYFRKEDNIFGIIKK